MSQPLEFEYGFQQYGHFHYDFYWRVLNGDSEKVLSTNMNAWKELGPDCVVTDPPYATGLAEWDEGVGAQKIYDLCHEILKPGGYFLAFASSKYFHLTTQAMEKAGFHINDMLIWTFNHRTPKGYHLGNKHRKDIAKKIEEGLCVNSKGEYLYQPDLNLPYYAVLPDIEKSKAQNKLVAITDEAAAIKELKKTFLREADLLDAYRSDLMPRFDPIILGQKKRDGSIVNNLAMHGCGALNIQETGEIRTDGKSETRGIVGRKYTTGEFFCEKASYQERNAGVSPAPTGIKNAWGAGSVNQPNFHPTIKPRKLMQHLVKLVCPKHGVVIDPFCGSGGTLLGAIGWAGLAYGIEMNPEYARISSERLTHWCNKENVNHNNGQLHSGQTDPEVWWP